MTRFQLAQINIGTLKAPVSAPEIAGFTLNLDRINALAETSPGFIWRLTGTGNDATDIRVFDNPLVAINMSVWANPKALAAFVYRSAHRDIMRQRAAWFDKMEVFQCLWWVPSGHLPSPREGLERLDLLRRRGPTDAAFTFRDLFPAPDELHAPAPISDRCA